MAYASVDKALDYGRRAQAKLAEVMQKSEHTIKMVKQTVEVAGAAFAQGAVAGYMSDGTSAEYKIASVPVDLASGIVLMGVAMVAEDQLGAYAEDLHNLGLGSLAYYAGRMGPAFGHKMKDKMAARSAPAALPATAGYGALGASALGYSPLSAEEIAALAHGSYAR